MKLISILKYAVYGKMDRSFYIENKEELRDTNYRLLRKACIFSTFVCFVLFLLTLFNSLVSELTTFYLGFSLFFALQTELVLTVVKTKKKLIPPCFYTFAAAVFTLVILAGTVYTPGLPAVTFHVFLMIIPILFVTRPVYPVLLSIGACAAFCIVTVLVKGPQSYYAQTDILNALCCCVVGIGLDLTIINLQLEYIDSKIHFRHQSATDELTGLPNRRSFDLYIEQNFTKCLKAEENLYVLMMDIDNFKSYNDTYGHVKGDECLRRVSAQLRETAKENGIFLARFGGEEFIAVATDISFKKLHSAAVQFVSSVADLEIPHEKSSLGKITVSLGFADLYQTNAADYRKLLDCADTALYMAKANGKNQVHVFLKKDSFFSA